MSYDTDWIRRITLARRSTAPTQPQGPAKLVVPRNAAREQLQSRVVVGRNIFDKIGSIANESHLSEVDREFNRWSDYNQEMLRRMFDSEEYMTGYVSAYPPMSVLFNERSLREEIKHLREQVQYKLDNLESLSERLDLIDESASALSPTTQPTPRAEVAIQSLSNDVFLVHGRDEEMKNIVARFIERCNLRPIVLSEQPDQGRTIIEKFEQEANVGFAVILLSPDDVGGLAASPGTETQLQTRARQNVILELGYFLGRLGRPRVCAIMRGDVEVPSDFSGVVYTPFSSDEGWKIKLARELKSAGLEVDLNIALG